VVDQVIIVGLGCFAALTREGLKDCTVVSCSSSQYHVKWHTAIAAT